MIFLRMISFLSIMISLWSILTRIVSFEGISLDPSLNDIIMVNNNDIILIINDTILVIIDIKEGSDDY